MNKNKDNHLKVSISDLTNKDELSLEQPSKIEKLDLSGVIATVSWPLALYKFVHRRSQEMFK